MTVAKRLVREGRYDEARAYIMKHSEPALLRCHLWSLRQLIHDRDADGVFE